MKHRNKCSRNTRKICGVVITTLLLSLANSARANEEDAAAIENLSINDLMQIEVSSVSRKSQTLSNTAAAAFIITQEDIRRSGATSIPETLRYVPGLEVAQGASNTWDISARGFSSAYANKLLVLIDGRAVYSPLYAGVIWELQDTMMEDIERIEVIRGPGAAMWGSNAVNGVINVITKKTKYTRGDLLVAGTGNHEPGFAGFRHGGSIEDGSYRIYGKGFSRDATVNAAGAQQDDAWRSRQIGFRMDRLVASGDQLTLQGDAYSMKTGTPLKDNAVFVSPWTAYTPNDAPAHGGNLMARWDSILSNGSEMSLQGYYDRFQIDALFAGVGTETVDIDFQHRLHPNASHDLMWGVNYRHIHFAIKNTPNMSFVPPGFGYQNASAFAQDDIALVADRLRLTLGAKLEDSYFGGMQFQPNARLLWTPDNTNSVWFAASKASRTPSLIEAKSASIAASMTAPSVLTGGLPVQVVTSGNPNLKAEKMIALEAGYRTQWNPRLSTDIAIYSNEYNNRSQAFYVGGVPTPALALTPVPHLTIPLAFNNATTTTRVNGLEISAEWRALDWMRLEGAFTYAKMNAPSWDGINTDYARLIPRTQKSLRCLMDLNEKTKLNLALRHVGALDATTAGVPAYTAADANVAYTPRKGLDLSLVALNLLGPHVEFVNNAFGNRLPSQIRRSVYAKVTWNL